VRADPWSSEAACALAIDVFALGVDYPALRPRGVAACGAVREAAARLGDHDGAIPRSVVESLLERCDARDLHRLELLAGVLAPGRWRPLVDAVGAEHAREPLYAGVLSAAVAERQPPPQWLAVMREGTADDAPGPVNVLASLLRPESVWSIDEARTAQALAAPIGLLPRKIDSIRSFASSKMDQGRLDRLRVISEPVESMLPVAGAPRTTAHLDEACALVAADDGASSEACFLLLLTYVMGLEGALTIVPSQN